MENYKLLPSCMSSTSRLKKAEMNVTQETGKGRYSQKLCYETVFM